LKGANNGILNFPGVANPLMGFGPVSEMAPDLFR